MSEIEEYLISKGIDYIERRGELLVKCIFGGCDEDSRREEYHLSFNAGTGQYHCFKCEAIGNLITLKKHFGDFVEHSKKQATEPTKKENGDKPKPKAPGNDRRCATVAKEAKKRHEQLLPETRRYLNDRGISDVMIDAYCLGQAKYYGFEWITIPVRGLNGETEFLKLRRMPTDTKNPDKYKVHPGGGATLFNGHDLLTKRSDEVMIVEGEFDAIVATQHQLPLTVSSTAGAGTFKEDWMRCFEHASTVWLFLDNDNKGRDGAIKILEMFQEHYPDTTIMSIEPPDDIKDLTEYFQAGYTKEALFAEYATHVSGDEPLNPEDMREMSIDDLTSILDSTIKFDTANKSILFLTMLTAYTEEDQLNAYLTGPSSSGKTYLAQEVSYYFPEEDIERLSGVSPTAFKHREPDVDTETGEKYVNCERKILLFTELPHHELQKNLRQLLSHDSKIITFLTTDKNKSGGLEVKTSHIRGFAATIFCSASNNMDEQEKTRALLLSPEISQEKIDAGKIMQNEKSSNPKLFRETVEANTLRKQLKRRVRFVKKLGVDSVIIPNKEKVLEMFNASTKNTLPRHQRDIAHVNSLIKAVALLNAHSRLDENHNVIATDGDIDVAFELWGNIKSSQELGVTPYVENFYRTYILEAYHDKLATDTNAKGVTREEVAKKYYSLHGYSLNSDSLRRDIIPSLKVASIIDEIKDEEDKKRKLIVPLLDVVNPIIPLFDAEDSTEYKPEEPEPDSTISRELLDKLFPGEE